MATANDHPDGQPTRPQSNSKGLIDHKWPTYRAVLDADLMGPRAIAAVTAKALTSHLAHGPVSSYAPKLVDLGLGN